MCVVLGYYLGRWTHAPLCTGSPWLVLTRNADHINATTHLSLPHSLPLSSFLSHSCHLHSLRSLPDIINPLQSPETHNRALRGAGQALPRTQPPSCTFNLTTTPLSNKHMWWSIRSMHTREILHHMTDSRVHCVNIYTPKQTQKVQWKWNITQAQTFTSRQT